MSKQQLLLDRAIEGGFKEEDVQLFLEAMIPYLEKRCRARTRFMRNAPQDAADLLQDICVEIVKSIRKYKREIATVEKWVAGIIRNVWIRFVKREGYKVCSLPPDEVPSHTDDDPSEIAARADTDRFVQELLNQLPPKWCDPVRLKTMQGWQWNDIARYMGCSVSKVKRDCAVGMAVLGRRLRREVLQ